MKEKIVVDGHGNEIPERLAAICHEDGKYYLKSELVEVRSKLYLKTSTRITIDAITGKYGLIGVMARIITDFSYSVATNRFKVKEEGYTNVPYLAPIIVVGDSSFSISNLEVIKANGFIEGIRSGLFFHESEISKDKDSRYHEVNATKKITGNKLEDFSNGTDSPTFLITEGLSYTFGVEMETSGGVIPGYLGKNINFKCMRDGSISGGEYVTGVLKGDKGFENLQLLANEAAKRCTVDRSCGVHVHVGGASFNQAFIVFSYKLAQLLESELFSILPPSRRRNEYCRSLPKLNLNFNGLESGDDFNYRVSNYYNEIFRLLSQKNPSKDCNKFTNHPRGPRCGYDHSTPRYCWLNFVPAVFNTKTGILPGREEPPRPGEDGAVGTINKSCKSYTLEFRSHSGTTNFTKIKNWVKICMAFVHFADNYHMDIIAGETIIDDKKVSLNLGAVIMKAYPKTGASLMAFINKRKEIFNSESPETAERSEYSKVKIDSIKTQSIKELIE